MSQPRYISGALATLCVTVVLSLATMSIANQDTLDAKSTNLTTSRPAAVISASEQQPEDALEDEDIVRQLLSSGGSLGNSAGGEYSVTTSVGQLALGAGTAGEFGIFPGLWHESGATACCGMYDPENRTGNVDQDPGNVKDLTDILTLASYAFLGGAAPPCMADMNVSGDLGCVYDLSDILNLASYAYLGGDPPAYCIPECD